MTINLKVPDIRELKPRIIVFGCGGAGGNAVNNMITSGLEGVDFVVANTDAQALSSSKAERVIQMGLAATEGLGAGSVPEVGRAAAEEVIDEVSDHLNDAHMVFITAGMGGGTGTGAAPVIARAARELGILTVGVVTKPFDFEGPRRMRIADAGIEELQKNVDTLIIIPNQNLFRIANERTTFADAFAMADQVLYSGVACITDLMVKEGLINLDFADVRSIMRGMGKAMMGTGEASGDKRALQAAEAAIANPLLDDVSMRGAKGLLISITGGNDMTLFELDEAATRIREEVDTDANIILGATFDETLEGMIRVSVVATGIDAAAELASQESAPLVTRRPAPRVAAPVAPAAIETAFEAATLAPQATAADLGLEEALMGSLERELSLPEPEAKDVAPAATRSVSDPSVSIKPYKPAESLFDLDEEPLEVEKTPAKSGPTGPFIPPVAERPERAAPRIPSAEDFPPIAQSQFKAQDADEDHEDRGPMSILRKLAGVSLGRHGEAPAGERHEPEARVMPRRPLERDERPAGGLDSTGRSFPAAHDDQDDPMEIPAFLRRAHKG